MFIGAPFTTFAVALEVGPDGPPSAQAPIFDPSEPGGRRFTETRAPRLFDELGLCHADGSFRKRLATIAKLQLIVIDDFAINPLGPRERNDLLELLDDRVGSRASILTSQLPIEHWHEYLNDPTLADAIMDRLVHCSHQIHLKGKESMRKRVANPGKDVAKD